MLERDEHGNEWWEIRIEELPDFFVAARTRDEAIAEAAPALAAFLESYLGRGELPPLPEGFGNRGEVPEGYEVRLRNLDPQPA